MKIYNLSKETFETVKKEVLGEYLRYSFKSIPQENYRVSFGAIVEGTPVDEEGEKKALELIKFVKQSWEDSKKFYEVPVS